MRTPWFSTRWRTGSNLDRPMQTKRAARPVLGVKTTLRRATDTLSISFQVTAQVSGNRDADISIPRSVTHEQSRGHEALKRNIVGLGSVAPPRTRSSSAGRFTTE